MELNKDLEIKNDVIKSHLQSEEIHGKLFKIKLKTDNINLNSEENAKNKKNINTTMRTENTNENNPSELNSKNKILKIRTDAIIKMNFLFILHTIFFFLFIILQYKVYYRCNLTQSLSNYFDINSAKMDKTIGNSNSPEAIIKNLLLKFKKNSFWFLDSKFEVYSNIRITQRVIKSKGDIISNLIVSNDIKDRIHTFDLFKIDPHDTYNSQIETNELLHNKYNYNQDDCNYKKLKF